LGGIAEVIDEADARSGTIVPGKIRDINNRSRIMVDENLPEPVNRMRHFPVTDYCTRSSLA
jgi:hypothetical protein